MDQRVLQVLLALAMFITTAIAGLISFKVLSILTGGDKQSKSGAKWLSLLSCFSGGVFMSTGFLDIIPHISENYALFLKETQLEWSFPAPYFLLCVGFFLVYLIEEMSMVIFKMGHSHNEPKVIHEEHHGVENLRKQVLDESVKYAMGSSAEEASFLKSITFTIAMSFHSILEGFALGVQESTSGIITLFVSLIIHKAVESFSVGLQVSKGNANRKKVAIATMLIYALMTPVGSILGSLLQNSSMEPIHKVGLIVMLESMAAGTFIYVTFLEILAQERDNEHNSLKQLLAQVVGFLVIAALQFFFAGHGHGGGHVESAHEHDHHH